MTKLCVRLHVGEPRDRGALNDQLYGRCTVFLAPVVAGSLPVQHGAFSVLDLQGGVGHELISFCGWLPLLFICSSHVHVTDVPLD